MSIRAMTWAYDQDVRPSVKKFLLVTLADYASDETGFAYPSIATLADRTAMDRKTAIGHLDALIKEGFISDTGKRVGNTKQVIVYQIRYKTEGDAQKNTNSPNNGTVTPPGNSPVFPGNSPVFPIKQSQKRDTDPSGILSGTPRSCAKAHTEEGGKPEKPKAPRPQFSPPTLEMMKLYAAKIGLPEEEAVYCFDHHERDNWTLRRGVRATNWEACMRTWKHNWEKRQLTRTGGTISMPSSPSPTAVRIGLEKELERTNEAIDQLKQEMHYDWDKTPERRTRMARLRADKERITLALGKVSFGANGHNGTALPVTSTATAAPVSA